MGKSSRIVECDGCMEKFDASDYENISSRHPHYNFEIEKELRKRDRKKKGFR